MSVPDPAAVDWVPLYNLQSAIPPVVNGQWIKGVSGAAVWSPITIDDITSVKTRIIAGSVAANGAIGVGSGLFTVAHPSAGNYTITLVTAMVQPMIFVTPTGQSVVSGGIFVSTTTAFVYMTTPGAWVDAQFSFLAYDALLDQH